jgi:hypothetical protein
MRRIYDVDVLLEQYHSSLKPGPGTLVRLIGLDGRDGYNPSNPVPDGAHPYTYVRVEPRQDEFDSWSVPFRQRAVDRWELDEHLPRLRLQDPSVAVLNGTLVVGGVRIVDQSPRHVIWETVFYRGPRLESLSEFARSPLLMKDVRLIEIEPSIIGVFTRPLGGKAGRGQIGYTEISSIDELTTAVMAEAEMIESQPIAEHWWGANAVYRLDLASGQVSTWYEGKGNIRLLSPTSDAALLIATQGAGYGPPGILRGPNQLSPLEISPDNPNVAAAYLTHPGVWLALQGGGLALYERGVSARILTRGPLIFNVAGGCW